MKKIVAIDDLSRATQFDIAENLQQEVTSLADEEPSWIRDQLVGFEPPTPVVLTRVDPRKMLAQFRNRYVSEVAVKKLAKVLSEQTDLDPILLSHGKFLDGGHRVTAYIKEGRRSMPAVDIGHLINMNWQRWLDAEEVSFDL